jgi:hypothetical protein
MINNYTATYEYLDEDTNTMRSTTAFFKFKAGTYNLDDVRYQLITENRGKQGFKIISITENITNPAKRTLLNKDEVINSIIDLGKKLRVKTININQQLREAYVAFFDPSMQQYMELSGTAEWKHLTLFERELNVGRCKVIRNPTTFVDVTIRPNFRWLLERGLGKKVNALKNVIASMSKEQMAATFVRLFEHRDEVVMLDMSLWLEDFVYDFAPKPGYEIATNTHGIIIYDVLVSNQMKLTRYESEFKNAIDRIKKSVDIDSKQNAIYLEVFSDKDNLAGNVLNNPKTISLLKSALTATDIVFKYSNDFDITHAHIIEVNDDKMFVLFYREELEK